MTMNGTLINFRTKATHRVADVYSVKEHSGGRVGVITVFGHTLLTGDYSITVHKNVGDPIDTKRASGEWNTKALTENEPNPGDLCRVAFNSLRYSGDHFLKICRVLDNDRYYIIEGEALSNLDIMRMAAWYDVTIDPTQD